MATDDRQPAADLNPAHRPLGEQLFEDAPRFDFFQAVYLLERWAPEKPRVGETAHTDAEPVRFDSDVRLDFPASDITRIAPPRSADAPAEMTVSFMSLAGHFGPLPDNIAELIMERAKDRDRAFKAFLDIFNHRLISLLYRIRKKHRIALSGARPEDTTVAQILWSLIGLGTPGLRGRMAVPDRAFLGYAGLMARQPRTAIGLQLALSLHFRCPVRLEPLVGRWIDLPPDTWTVLGGPKAQNATLGLNVLVGRRIWDQQGAYRLWLGPLRLPVFQGFLPGIGTGYPALADFVKFYAGDELDWELMLQLDPAEMPGCMISASDGARLGWTSWLKSGDYTGALEPVRIAGPPAATA